MIIQEKRIWYRGNHNFGIIQVIHSNGKQTYDVCCYMTGRMKVCFSLLEAWDKVKEYYNTAVGIITKEMN